MISFPRTVRLENPQLTDKQQKEFEKIFEENYNTILRFCLRVLGDEETAKDMVQTVFMRAWSKLETFRGESAVSTWLCAIAKNFCKMFLREKRISTVPFDMLRERENEIKVLVKTEDSICERILVVQAIKKLAQGYRTVLILHDIEGYGYKEIASMLGISVGTAKSQLHKARLKLRKLLTEGKGREN